MPIYVLTDGRGTYIRLDPSTKRYVPIKDHKQALQFQDRAKAANILKSCIEKKLQKQFYVKAVYQQQPENLIPQPTPQAIKTSDSVPHETFSEIKTNRNTDVLKSIIDRFTVHSDIPEWVEKINIIGDLFSSTAEKMQNLAQELGQTQKEITDIEHYIEFTNFNAYEGYLAAKMLKQRLQRRRIFKDSLLILNQIRKCKVDPVSITNLKKSIDGLSKRKYQPRVLSQLFNEE